MLKHKTWKHSITILASSLILLILSGLVAWPLATVMGMENNDSLLSSNHNSTKIITAIINYGSLAPSTHNAQMWKVKMVSEHEIIVLLDQAHVLPQVDPSNREAMISLGAFIENMVEAAPIYNLEAKVALIVQKPQDDMVARITFFTQSPASDPNLVLENLKNRHTIRTPYLKKELTEQDLKSLLAYGPQLSYFPLRDKEGQYLKEAVIQSTRQQVANDEKQAELAGFMHFSKKESEAKTDGLTPEMMGLSGIVKWYVTTFFNQNTVLTKSFREQTVATAKRQAENCAGFVIITSPDNSVESLVNVGRTLEEFLINATGKKIAVQPLSAPLEESPWKEELSQKIGVSHEIQMLLRVGYVKDYGKPVSKRRPVLIIPQ